MTEAQDPFEAVTIRCENAKQLLEELDLANERWSGDETWVFRGQNNADWPLHPSAMRYGKIQVRSGSYDASTSQEHSTDPLTYVTIQVALEKYLAHTFYTIAHRTDLSIPATNVVAELGNLKYMSEFLNEYHTAHQNRDASFGFEPINIIYALLQHHGIPTRLLDWTYLPLVALYFAAQCSEEAPSYVHGNAVVWAVKSSRLTTTNLRLVTHQFHEIDSLRAQRGVFMYDKIANEKFMQHKDWVPHEDELIDLIESGSVYKLQLPRSETQDVLKIIERKRISDLYMFPSVAKVSDATLRDFEARRAQARRAQTRD